ncbi:hypothetical protein T01_3201 [Trichinella spiralis]|uniref:Uncharacterized protein n=1 Tax=Trichinella spiralis TaxID=6334 RepID=A0A0V1B0Q4_TRISP|nr:hypothetical protein T01_3201 [Trichinella spiralis]
MKKLMNVGNFELNDETVTQVGGKIDQADDDCCMTHPPYPFSAIKAIKDDKFKSHPRNDSNSSNVESGGAVSEVGRCSSLISKRLLSMCHHYQRISVMQKPRTQAAISQFCPSVAIFIG